MDKSSQFRVSTIAQAIPEETQAELLQIADATDAAEGHGSKLTEPQGRRYTSLSYQCRHNNHSGCTARRCQCPCGHFVAR